MNSQEYVPNSATNSQELATLLQQSTIEDLEYSLRFSYPGIILSPIMEGEKETHIKIKAKKEDGSEVDMGLVKLPISRDKFIKQVDEMFGDRKKA